MNMAKKKWNGNANHPAKGSSCLVEPIRDPVMIARIKDLLADKPRDLALFVIGINNGLRAGDLLRLRVKDVRRLKAGDTLKIKESKTNKTNVLMINEVSFKALREWLLAIPDLNDNDPLFISSTSGEALTVPALNLKIKRWCKAVGLDGNYGCHTLRKTFGYQQRTRYGTGYEILCKRFNHSSPTTTQRYLGIEDSEVNGILLNEI